MLNKFNLPLPVRSRQLIKTVKRPTSSWPMEKYMDDEQLGAFESALHAIKSGDSDRIREELGYLDGVGLSTFVPSGSKEHHAV